jgi:hypothetical protein
VLGFETQTFEQSFTSIGSNALDDNPTEDMKTARQLETSAPSTSNRHNNALRQSSLSPVNNSSMTIGDVIDELLKRASMMGLDEIFQRT